MTPPRARLEPGRRFLTGPAAALCGSLLIPHPTSLPAGETNGRAQTARLIPSPEPGWPQWRGPRRDGLCDETGLLQQWSEGGPPLLWKTNGLGRGYPAPVITGGRLFLTGDVGEDLQIFALDRQGRRLWQSKNGRSWTGPYPGARAICAVGDGRVFHLNAHGRLACWDAVTGVEVWSVDLLERFGGRVNTWAYSECVLVDGPRVIVTPGGTRALLAALDVRTGRTVWTTEPLRLGKTDSLAQERVAEPAGEADHASYSSPILFQLGGRRHLVNCSLRHVFGVDADTGELLWTRPLRTRYSVIAATPVLVGHAVFVTAPDTDDAGLYRIRPHGRSVGIDQVWATSLDTCHGGSVSVGDALYGSWYRRAKGWACLDARTGQVRSQLKDLAKGSVLFADRRLYCLSEEGEMALLEPAPTGFNYAGRFRLVPERQSDVWTHPVIAEGRLYLRYHEMLFCFDIRGH